ncbi:vacuolar protein sorting-associated protein 4A-like isoform X2 [Dreissena polymorpha]|uniref:vacuolar protein sorting-associated protein 4A-like isoform X2 n=1 Tax=Dreissena polymorpha TaxID=45954 RepID=UPI0022644D91|nr:vacuolar protein sorting-associated protein 4A-like isoform X2 [Dreissena polymorpha]
MASLWRQARNLEQHRLEPSSVMWEDVAGLKDAKSFLQLFVIVPLIERERTANIKKRILLVGAAGVGKTYLVQGLVSELHAVPGCYLYVLYAEDLWRNRVRLRDLRETIRAFSPCVVVIDGVDILKVDPRADETTSARVDLLETLEHLKDYDTIFIGLTNKPWDLDPSIRDRFYTQIYLPMPDADARNRILRNLVAGEASAIGDMECRSLSERLAGFSGADISRLVRHVDMEQIRALQRASHFKRVTGPSSTQPFMIHDFLTPCEPNDPGAMVMTFDQAAHDNVLLPEMTAADLWADLWNSVDTIKPSVTEDMVQRFLPFQQALDFRYSRVDPYFSSFESH